MEEQVIMSVERFEDMKDREAELKEMYRREATRSSNNSETITGIIYEIIRYGFVYKPDKTKKDYQQDMLNYSVISKIIDKKYLSNEYAEYLISKVYEDERNKYEESKNDKD